jgi:hypothetical protein
LAALLAELALDEGDELVGGHGVEFDPLAERAGASEQVVALTLGRLVDAQASGGRGLAALDGDRLGRERLALGREPLDVVEAQPEVDHGLDRVPEFIAAARGEQGLLDRESGEVEVVQDVERQASTPAKLLDQRPPRRDRHALARHQGEVEPLGDPRLFEDRVEALLLDVRHPGEAARRSLGPNARRGDLHRADPRLMMRAVPHGLGAEADLMAGVRLAEVAPVVPDDVPVGGLARMRVHVVGHSPWVKYLLKFLPSGLPTISWIGPRAAYMIWRGFQT